MKTQSTFQIWLLVGATIITIGIGLSGPNKVDEKFEECINLVRVVVPDPNDTEERSKFIRECYETPNEESKTEIKKAE